MTGISKLCKAVERNDIRRVQRLVREGTNINGKDAKGRTVLHYAAEQGKKNMVECLLGLGARVNVADRDKMTPLHHALTKKATEYIREKIMKDISLKSKRNKVSQEEMQRMLGSRIEKTKVDIIECLCKHGADINARFDSNNPLHDAVKRGDIQEVIFLIRLGMNVNAVQVTGMIGLTVALVLQESVVTKHLIELGADVNSTFDGSTALFEAVKLERCDIVKILVDNGADVAGLVNFYDTPVFAQTLYLKETPLNPEVFEFLVMHGAINLSSSLISSNAIHEALKLNQAEILEYLIKDEREKYSKQFCISSSTILLSAVMNDEYDYVRLLCNHGADINALSYDYMPLAEAIRLGNVHMVKPLLFKSVAMMCLYFHGISALFYAVELKRIEMVQLLLKYPAVDVNAKYDSVTVLHEAVRQGDKEMVQVLADLGADINWSCSEGRTILHVDKISSECNYALDVSELKILIDGGVDFNAAENNVTALHLAVRLSDTGMVETLARLGADINSKTLRRVNTPHMAVYRSRIDIVEYLVKEGADINAIFSDRVRPLHDAVQQGNTEMVKCLVKLGADAGLGRREGLTVMSIALWTGNYEMIKYLVDLGADVNAMHMANISPLQDAVIMQHSNSEWMKILFLLQTNGRPQKAKIVSLLDRSIVYGQTEITEYLLTQEINSANKEDTVHAFFEDTRLERLAEGPVKDHLLDLLMCFGDAEFDDHVGASLLHTACLNGKTDLARLIIIDGRDINRTDRHGKLPLEHLSLAGTVDYHVLHEITATEKVIEVGRVIQQPVVSCQNMQSLHCTLGIGNVVCIPPQKCRPKDIYESVHKCLLHMSKRRDELFPLSSAKLKGCGSSAEGTKVGLPDEMDFLFEIPLFPSEEADIKDAGYGYFHYKGDRSKPLHCWRKNLKIFDGGSYNFHALFASEVAFALCNRLLQPQCTMNCSITQCAEGIFDDSNRKACLQLLVKWKDDQTTFLISVDAVPCLHIANWPDGAITRTWLMEYHDLKNRGYNLVPKPPNLKSRLAKQYTSEELQALWRISFSHLETEHMQQLENRVKDVYVTAKCLRNPDVCRIMVTDEGSLPRNVDRYITTYLIKMVFFKNVEDFLSAELSLEEMVCKVYNDLADDLSRGYIPLFFMPTINVLDGLKLNVPKCAEVANVMKRFVQALYLRDIQEDPDDYVDDEEIIVYQRKPRAVYRSFDISPQIE